MAVSKAQQNATNKWIAKAYDRINLTVPKGKKEEIQAFAEANGESVNGFINRAISETMGRLPRSVPQEPAEARGGGGAILSPETLAAAQEAAQKAGETVPVFIGRAVTTQAQRDRVTQGLRSQAKETK